MEMTSRVIDVDSGNFEEVVLQGSQERVVVVDFWAPWCGPCKTLGPMLEEVVTALGPGVALAKVNVDDNQDLAMTFRVQGIPAVKIVKDGQLVDEFTGALPRQQVEEVLRRHVPEAPPSEEEVADDLVEAGRARIDAGDLAGAASLFEQALRGDEDNGAAWVGLARVRLLEDRFDEVRELVGRIEQGTSEYDQGQALLKQLDFHRLCEEAGGRQACAGRLLADASDLEARYRLGCCAAVDGDYATALQEWFQVLQKNGNYGQGAVKEAMASIFHLLGRRHPVVDDYPQRLYRLLY